MEKIEYPALQKFVGALHGQHATKGVFPHTSQISRGARAYTKNIDSKVVLIDGTELAELMIDNGVGVSPHANYEVKRIDTEKRLFSFPFFVIKRLCTSSLFAGPKLMATTTAVKLHFPEAPKNRAIPIIRLLRCEKLPKKLR